MIERYKKIADEISQKVKFRPEIGIILGSGLGKLADKIQDPITLCYSEIKDFPVSTVEGHDGKFVFGKIGGKPVMVMKGRFHYYEGYDMEQVTLPVRVMKLLGVEKLFVSNAAGGLNSSFKVGDIMIIKDHINFFPQHPLRGKNIAEMGPRFPDMNQPYSLKLIQIAKEMALEMNLEIKEGVYIGSSGPTFETPAEYNMFRIWGADATGMSTVPEVIIARHCGIECFGISVITNVSHKNEKATENLHEDVLKVAATASENLCNLVEKMMGGL